MAERALKCPQCSAPLTVSRFARRAVCPYCGSTVVLDSRRTVPAARFREAHRVWNAPQTHGYTHWLTVGDGHWALETLAAHGEISDVYFARRARWPTERVVPGGKPST
jgi:DNA-directed RNA polymerase subunit RPC12/RpoP